MRKKHILIDWWFNNDILLRYPEPVTSILVESVKKGGLDILNEVSHQFKPFGFTMILILGQSHISAHSWVDEHLLTIDIFSCKTDTLDEIISEMRKQLAPIKEKLSIIERGLPEEYQQNETSY